MFFVLASIPAQAIGDTDSAYGIDKQKEYAPGQIIVKVKEGVNKDYLLEDYAYAKPEKMLDPDKIKSPKAQRELEKRGLNRLYLLKTDEDVGSAISELQGDPNIEYAEPNYIVTIDQTLPNDPNFVKLWGLSNPDYPGCDIYAPGAWDVQTGSRDVIVAVIDTGVDYNHPDLRDNIWTNPDEIAGNGIDDDGNGFIDDLHGYDFCNDNGDPMDDHYHGTHCAGTIGAAGDNGIGIVGVNWHISIMPIKFLDEEGSGYTYDAVRAVAYATLMGADVMSNSWGGGDYSQALKDAIDAAGDRGILFVASAGNSGVNIDQRPSYPASYTSENIIAVAATDDKDAKASWSNWGFTSVDIGAPGVGIYSTRPGNSYGYLSGTSMACPHVAGAAALVKAQYHDLTSGGVKNKILYGANKIPSMEGKVSSGGRLNLFKALRDDDIPPADINDLKVTNAGPTSITLSWTAVGDDGISGGSANFYNIRYSTALITEDNWAMARQASGEPLPGIPCTEESLTVGDLIPQTEYYFAGKSFDGVGNPSGLSNIAVGTTTISEDVVRIWKAEYDSKKSTLTVQATSTMPGASLMLKDYGPMNCNSPGSYNLVVTKISANPGSVTVTSSLGGMDTKTVNDKFKR